MRRFALALAVGALFALPLPASAAPLSTELSSQIRIGPGGVQIGHGRFDSRRRDRDVHHRHESRRRDRDVHHRHESRRRDRGHSCRTVTTRQRLPGGGVKIVKRKDC